MLKLPIERHTVHKVGQIDLEAALGGIVVREDAAVGKLPSKGVRNDDNHTPRGPSSRFGDIGIQPVRLGHLPFRLAMMDGSGEAIWAGHVFDRLGAAELARHIQKFGMSK